MATGQVTNGRQETDKVCPTRMLGGLPRLLPTSVGEHIPISKFGPPRLGAGREDNSLIMDRIDIAENPKREAKAIRTGL
jgi:hypothetical protein